MRRRYYAGEDIYFDLNNFIENMEDYKKREIPESVYKDPKNEAEYNLYCERGSQGDTAWIIGWIAAGFLAPIVVLGLDLLFDCNIPLFFAIPIWYPIIGAIGLYERQTTRILKGEELKVQENNPYYQNLNNELDGAKKKMIGTAFVSGGILKKGLKDISDPDKWKKV